MKMVKFTPEACNEFYRDHVGKPFFPALKEFMTSDVSVAMELVRENAIEHWRKVAGPTNSIEAQDTAPDSLRAQFGIDVTKNAVHGSDSRPNA